MSTHPLLAPLTESQQAVVDIVSNVWLEHAKFPAYGYVERELDARGVALEAVLTTFPGIGRSQMGPTYQAVWYDRYSGNADRPLGLTIAGLGRHQPAAPVVDAFLQMLNMMARKRSAVKAEPFHVEDPVVNCGDLWTFTSTGVTALDLRDLVTPDLFRHEPATWGGDDSPIGAADWSWKCVRQTRYFEGVTDVSDYLNRLSAYLTPPPTLPATEPDEPPLGLAAELDFLDTVWRLRYGTARPPLLALRGALPVARLSMDVASAEEFDARLSDLAQVLKSFDLEGIAGHKNRQHPVQRLVDHLQDDLHIEEGASARIAGAGAVLEAAIDIRNGGVHHNAATKAVSGLKTLRIGYPITDWHTAWRTIRSAVTRAVASLREELQAND